MVFAGIVILMMMTMPHVHDYDGAPCYVMSECGAAKQICNSVVNADDIVPNACHDVASDCNATTNPYAVPHDAPPADAEHGCDDSGHNLVLIHPVKNLTDFFNNAFYFVSVFNLNAVVLSVGIYSPLFLKVKRLNSDFFLYVPAFIPAEGWRAPPC